jgi:hypothetical protein
VSRPERLGDCAAVEIRQCGRGAAAVDCDWRSGEKGVDEDAETSPNVTGSTGRPRESPSYMSGKRRLMNTTK